MDSAPPVLRSQYESEKEADAAREALYGVQWPPRGGKALTVQFATVDEMQDRLDPARMAARLAAEAKEKEKEKAKEAEEKGEEEEGAEGRKRKGERDGAKEDKKARNGPAGGGVADTKKDAAPGELSCISHTALKKLSHGSPLC